MKNPTGKLNGAAAKNTGLAKSPTSPAADKGQVKAKSTAADGLRELFIDSLKDIYWAEKALIRALPKMAKNTTSVSLTAAIEDHLAVTQGQVGKVEKVFELLGEKAVAKKCEAMEGLIKEGQEIMEGTEPGPVRDAGIIAASQKIEHYEIATYGTLAAFAKTLGLDQVADIFEEVLAEEKLADTLLSETAYNDINFEAAGQDDADQQENQGTVS